MSHPAILYGKSFLQAAKHVLARGEISIPGMIPQSHNPGSKFTLQVQPEVPSMFCDAVMLQSASLVQPRSGKLGHLRIIRLSARGTGCRHYIILVKASTLCNTIASL